MTDTFDPFHLDSGVKENFDGQVADAWFGQTDNAGDTLFLFLKILADDGEEVERRYSCGDGWKTFDGGITAEHPSRQYFQNNSNLGILLTRAFAVGGEDALRKRSADLDNKGPKAAKLWSGFRAHWDVERETFKIKDKDTGEMVERERVLVLPTQFLSMVDAAAASGSAPGAQNASGSSQAPPISGTPDASSNGGEVPPAFATVNAGMQQMIRSLAKQHDYGSWIDKVMALPGVIENDKLMAGISDEAFYTQLRDH